MNSFKTHRITTKLIRKYRKHNLSIHTVLQNCYPRISKTTLMPLPTAPFQSSSSEEWYPPGHGDIYYSLWSSGVLDSLIHDGKEYAFISNIDNLSATVDMDILYHVYVNDIEMCMEVTPPSRSDTDGGYLVSHGGRLRMMEMIEVNEADRDQFRRQHNLFNTNNLWINLRALKKVMEAGNIDNQVIGQVRELNGNQVLQLETTAGSAICAFERSIAIEVDRKRRYVPVKTTADLMLIQSDIFSIRHGTLHLNGPSLTNLPLIKLGSNFTSIDEYQRRLTRYRPNILELEHLTISGDVYIGANVTLKGTVIIIAGDGNVIMIPDGAVLKDKVVTGNLRILDH